MLDKINEINLEENISQDILYPLIQAKNPFLKLELLSKLQSFKTNKDFFTHYTNINLTSLENILNESKEKINVFTKDLTKNMSSEENEIENYLSIISNIIIINLICNNLENYINNIYTSLSDYIISILKNQKNEDIHYKLNEYLQLIENSSQKFKRKNIISFSRISTKENTNNDTPRFFEIIGDSNLSLSYEDDLNSCFNIYPKKLNSPRKSISSLSSMVFSPNKENDDSLFFSPKKKMTLLNIHPLNLNNDFFFTKEKCISLLSLCSEMFKKKIINSNEKIKFKKLIIGKDEKLLNIFNNCSHLKEKFFKQVKEYLSYDN